MARRSFNLLVIESSCIQDRSGSLGVSHQDQPARHCIPFLAMQDVRAMALSKHGGGPGRNNFRDHAKADRALVAAETVYHAMCCHRRHAKGLKAQFAHVNVAHASSHLPIVFRSAFALCAAVALHH